MNCEIAGYCRLVGSCRAEILCIVDYESRIEDVVLFM